jgi:hypothetical protein
MSNNNHTNYLDGRPCDPTFPVIGFHVPQYLCPPARRALCPAEARPLALSEPWVARGVAQRRAPSASGGHRPRLFPRPK